MKNTMEESENSQTRLKHDLTRPFAKVWGLVLPLYHILIV